MSRTGGFLRAGFEKSSAGGGSSIGALTVQFDCHTLGWTVVSKLCAVSFVLLSVLPFTAPFSTMNAADFIISRNADGEIGLLPIQASGSVADNTAMVTNRSDFFIQSRLCAVVAIALYDVVAALPLVSPPIASTTFTANLPPLTTVLRV